MNRRVIILNGVSSAGKSSIARALQVRLPEPWLAFSVDDLIAAMPAAMLKADGGFGIAAGGAVTVGERFIALNIAWEQGIAAMARAGAPVIIDDVFLRGRVNQDRWRAALDGLAALWVGVHCDPAVLAERERARGDRVVGMAADQLPFVHAGVTYDLEVDTSNRSPDACAALIIERLGQTATGCGGRG